MIGIHRVPLCDSHLYQLRKNRLQNICSEHVLHLCPDGPCLDPQAPLATHHEHPHSNPAFVLRCGLNWHFPRQINNPNKLSKSVTKTLAKKEDPNSRIARKEKAGYGDRDRQVPGAHWPGSLDSLGEPQASERPFFKTKQHHRMERAWGGIPCLTSLCVHACSLVHAHPCSCTHTSAHPHPPFTYTKSKM